MVVCGMLDPRGAAWVPPSVRPAPGSVKSGAAKPASYQQVGDDPSGLDGAARVPPSYTQIHSKG